MKTPGNWVVGIVWRLHRVEVDGDICLKRPRPTEGCRADDDDDDERLSYLTESSENVYNV
jgi:hypothetical protein